jgi:DME family drug/metabolite transporter
MNDPVGPERGVLSAPAPRHHEQPAGSVRVGLIQLTLTGVLWGSIGIVVRLLQNAHLSTASIAFWRFVCACLVRITILRARGLRELARHLTRPWRLLVVSLGSLAFQLLYFVAVADVGVSISTLIALGLAPVALSAARVATTRTMPSTTTLLIMAVALTGLVMVTTSGAHTSAGHHPGRGILEAVASGLCIAASTSVSATVSTRLAPPAITFATSVVGVVVLLPVVAVHGWDFPHVPKELAGTVWLGVITTVLAYGFFYAALRSVPGHIAMIVTLLEPATAVVLAAAILGEPFTVLDIVGAVLLLSAVALLFLTSPPQSARPIAGP